MNKTKTFLFHLINAIYIFIGILFLFFFKGSYIPVTTKYDVHLYFIVLFIYIVICVLTNSVISKIFSFIYVTLFGLYLKAQYIYHSVFSQYFRLSYVISLKSEINSFKSSVFEFVSFGDLLPFIIFGIISIVFIVIFFVFQRKLHKHKITLLIRLLVLFLLIPAYNDYADFNDLLNDAKYQEDFFQMNKTDYYLYDTMYSSNDFVDTFGILTFCYRDVRKTYESEDYYQYKDEVTEFLANKPNHQDNDLTGIFKGKDVIFIQAESYNRYALDEELTPTIYKMATKGISVKGFDTPALVGSTSDTEFMTNISIIPDSEEYASCYSYINNQYDQTLASIFKDAGYLTESYHNCYGIYYNRDKLFTTEFQYDTFRDCTAMGLEDATDDYTYARDLYWMYENTSQPFMTYWITYSGHQPYSLDSVGVRDEYVSLIKQKYPDLDEEHISYLAKNMDLDRTVGNIISTAKQLGRDQNLVIVFFGDHIAKGVDMYDKPQTELYIYCPGNELSLEYEKPSTCLDILPTIANMFGLEFDDKKVLGRDIFDKTYGGMCFTPYNDGKTKTYWFNLKGEITDLDGNQITDEEILNEAKRYIDYKRISKIIQKLDYFNNSK